MLLKLAGKRSIWQRCAAESSDDDDDDEDDDDDDDDDDNDEPPTPLADMPSTIQPVDIRADQSVESCD